MDPTDIADESFKRKKRRIYLSNDSFDMKLADNSDTNITQLRQNVAPSKVILKLHHQFSDIGLVSPLYHVNGATCYLSPIQRVDVGSTMQAGFNIDPNQKESTGALMYKIEREDTCQPIKEAISSEDKVTCTQLLIVWKIDSHKGFRAALDLIKHDKSRVWNRDELMVLAGRCRLFNAYSTIERTWSMHDNRVLMASLNAALEEEYYRLETIIYEGSIEDNARMPQYIDMDW
jgi:hypothetical protein